MMFNIKKVLVCHMYKKARNLKKLPILHFQNKLSHNFFCLITDQTKKKDFYKKKPSKKKERRIIILNLYFFFKIIPPKKFYRQYDSLI